MLSSPSSTAFLQQALELQAPKASSTVDGELEGAAFWEAHAELLRNAWREWETTQQQSLPVLGEEMIDANLRNAVNAVWADPSEEHEILKGLWQEVAPGVFGCQFFDPSKIRDLRQHIDLAEDSGIPLRRPNGMNRYGLILDQKTEGAVYLSGLETFYQFVVQHYIRPLGRYHFSEYFGGEDDAESYAFTIRYKEGEDTQLREHSDASLYTLNVNLNTPEEEEYEGSNIHFVDGTKKNHNISFSPGYAVLHRGMTRHAAHPIEKGQRTNLVVWLFGEYGYVRIAPYDVKLNAAARWTKTSSSLNKQEL